MGPQWFSAGGKFVLGADLNGRDVAVRLLYGGINSLKIGLESALLAVVPFVFNGFGDDLSQFQGDRVHPTAAAQPRILANVWPVLQPLLRAS